MFDYIKFEDTSLLPKPEGFDLDMEKVSFQTKSLDNCLYLFEVSKDKYLYREDGPFREDPKEPSRKCRIDFHGVINFGAYEVTDLLDHSIEYEAKFTDGILQDIKLLSYKTYTHESKKLQREKLKEEYQKENNKITRKFINFLQKIFIIYPLRLVGFNFESNAIGVFRSQNQDYALCLYCPKIIFGYAKQLRGVSYGFSLDKITTEICLYKYLVSKEFSFKILGFGFSLSKFEELI